MGGRYCTLHPTQGLALGCIPHVVKVVLVVLVAVVIAVLKQG